MSEFKSLDQLTIAQNFELSELLDRPALQEMAQSFEGLFNVSLRVYAVDGSLLADSQKTPAFYAFLEKSKIGRRKVQEVISQVRAVVGKKEAVLITKGLAGIRYLSAAIEHEGRLLGRTIVGPFIESHLKPEPEELFSLDPELDREELLLHWQALPRLSDQKAHQINQHLQSTLALLVFSGLKAHLASHMHMASVQESFRELSTQNHKLKEAYERLKELDRLKSNFLATVSHELRTPLTSIIGYSEMILQGIAGEVNEEQRDFVGTIHEKGEQLLDLIKSLLDLSKLESGTMSLRKEECSFATVVEQVVSTLTPVALQKKVYLVPAIEEGLPMSYADPERLRQVLLNLTENAIKFTPEDGCVTIALGETSLSTDVSGSANVLFGATKRRALQFSVTDTGVGIAEAEKNKIFDAFYQIDSSSTREAGGTGLGLSIVKRLVDAHEGQIQIEDNQPSGAVFLVTIPLAVAQTSPAI